LTAAAQYARNTLQAQSLLKNTQKKAAQRARILNESEAALEKGLREADLSVALFTNFSYQDQKAALDAVKLRLRKTRWLATAERNDILAVFSHYKKPYTSRTSLKKLKEVMEADETMLPVELRCTSDPPADSINHGSTSSITMLPVELRCTSDPPADSINHSSTSTSSSSGASSSSICVGSSSTGADFDSRAGSSRSGADSSSNVLDSSGAGVDFCIGAGTSSSAVYSSNSYTGSTRIEVTEMDNVRTRRQRPPFLQDSRSEFLCIDCEMEGFEPCDRCCQLYCDLCLQQHIERSSACKYCEATCVRDLITCDECHQKFCSSCLVDHRQENDCNEQGSSCEGVTVKPGGTFYMHSYDNFIGKELKVGYVVPFENSFFVMGRHGEYIHMDPSKYINVSFYNYKLREVFLTRSESQYSNDKDAIRFGYEDLMYEVTPKASPEWIKYERNRREYQVTIPY